MSKSVHDFTVQTIDGKPKPLGDYRGNVLLIVNVASECGYTPQYEGLEALQEKYRSQGLRVLGFPSNDFGGQEPGTNDAIQQFCTTRFGVTFDMFAKVALKGSEVAPLYDWLQNPETNPNFGGAVPWNFNKFLIGKNGEVVGRFLHKTDPLAPEVTAAIEEALRA
ncbi:glutathione peroxidase [Pendulispora albinea]|uniref:Glutathione peroxidase n=1 Tax=Pendulispora albinea TaxID=2741071 RepID=A0ABZ2M254_9BACT